MRKRIIALLLAVCMILSLASCKEKDSAEETRPDSAEDQSSETMTHDKNSNIIDTETTTAGETGTGGDDVFEQLQRGDFSIFAGTYMPAGIYHEWYGGGQQLPDLVLHEDGTISGGLVYGSYSTEKPTVSKNEDGSYLCQLFYQDEDYQEYYIIYPEGIIGPNPYIYNDPLLTSSVYIHCFSFNGGVLDIIYYQ